MELIIITPKEVIEPIKVSKVSLPGTQGAFTVLPNHAPLVSTLEKGMVRYGVEKEVDEKEFELEEGGVVVVEQNKVQIYIDR